MPVSIFFLSFLLKVAEMLENEELVGVVRGCIKEVGVGLESRVKMGCILGLRVSPRHQRSGIGFNLIKAVEEWLARNGAEYLYLATEDDNIASINLFTLKCHYKKLSSLMIFIRQVDSPVKKHTQKINIKKLQVNQAISLYENVLKCKDLYPTDIEAILRANPTLGTWVCYFNDEQWDCLHCLDHSSETIASRPNSWMVFSLWNSSEVYKLQIRRSCPLHYLLSAVLSEAKEVIFPCMKLPLVHNSTKKSFGFLFIYGFHGEGARLTELSKAAWNFAAKLGQDVGDCKLIMTEMGTSDPLFEHMPRRSSMFRIKDTWYFRNVNNFNGEDEAPSTIPSSSSSSSSSGSLGNVFIDPRDF